MGTIEKIKSDGFIKLSNIIEGPVFNKKFEIESKLLEGRSLEEAHLLIDPSKANDLRLESLKLVNMDKEFRNEVLHHLGNECEILLGSDLAIQKSFNIVCKFPNDPTYQIPLHSDTWSGNSPFEINLWIPLTKSYGDNSMFIFSPEKWSQIRQKSHWQENNLSTFMTKHSKEAQIIEASPGDAIIFWSHLPHGNDVHCSDITRWSLNIRIKNLFTPYGHKGLGDYFIPLKISPFHQMVLGEYR